MLSQLTTAIVEGTVHVGIVVKSAHLNLVAVNNNPRDRAVIRAIKSEGLGATGECALVRPLRACSMSPNSRLLELNPSAVAPAFA